MGLPPEVERDLLAWQKAEITGYETYSRLARMIKDEHNREVVKTIAEEEHGHYRVFKEHTGQETSPNWLQVFLFYWIARLLGLTFGIRLMERGEDEAQGAYLQFLDVMPEIRDIIADEEKHEAQLIDMLDEEVLKYTGSVVLGLNDALVELTGTLAGLTFAFQQTNLIALSGLITGISASFSMAASEYLSSRADEDGENALRSAVYTGIAYIFTVIILVLPYLLFDNYLLCLALTLTAAILVIAVFNFYLAVARDLNFRRRFLEMAGISMGVAVFSFGVGYFIRQVFGIEI